MALTGQEQAEILIALKDEVSAQLKQIKTAVKGLGKTAKEGQKDRDTLTTWMKTLGTQALAATGVTLGLHGAIAGIGAGMDALVEGEQINNMKVAFAGLDKDAQKIISMLKQKTGGLLTDKQLIKFAVATRGAKVSLEEMGRIAKLSFQLAAAQGEDAADVLQRFGVAVLTGRTAVVDQFGIIIQADKALRNYAASVGRNVSELSAQESQQIKMNAVLREADKIYGRVNVDDLSFSMQKSQVEARRLNDEMKSLAARFVETGLSQASLADPLDTEVFDRAIEEHWAAVGAGIPALIEIHRRFVLMNTDFEDLSISAALATAKERAFAAATEATTKATKMLGDAIIQQGVVNRRDALDASKAYFDLVAEATQIEQKGIEQTTILDELQLAVIKDKTAEILKQGKVSYEIQNLLFHQQLGRNLAAGVGKGIAEAITGVSAVLAPIEYEAERIFDKAAAEVSKRASKKSSGGAKQEAATPLGVTEADRLELQILSGLFTEAQNIELQYQADVERAREDWASRAISIDRFALEEKRAFYEKEKGLRDIAERDAQGARDRALDIAKEQIKREALLEGLSSAQLDRLNRDLEVKFGMMDAELAAQMNLTDGIQADMDRRKEIYEGSLLVAQSVAAGWAGALPDMQSIVGTLAEDTTLDETFVLRAEALNKFALEAGNVIAASLGGTAEQIRLGAAGALNSMGGLVGAFAGDAKIAAGIMAAFATASALLALPNWALAGKYAASAVMYGLIAGGVGVKSSPAVSRASPSISQTAAAPAGQGQTQLHVTVYNSGPAWATQDQIFESVIKGVNASARYGTLKIAKQAVEG